MKYILDSLGYIEAVSFEAGIEYQGRPGTPYTGKIPANYASLEEWEEKALINAYKIVNGDLVLDENRQKYLENKLAKELEDYTLATHKYVNDKVALENNLVSDELATEKSGTDFITLENTKDYSIPKINVDSTEDKEVVVTNKNLLSNDLINAGYRGIRLETNEDKSFKLDGKIDDYSPNLNAGVEETTTLKADINVDGKSEQKKLQGYNLISTDIALWEEGHYDLNGIPNPYQGRIRLKELFKVKPNTKYYFKVITDKAINTNNFSFVIRTYDKDMKFVSSWGGDIIDIVKDTPTNVEYLGIALYSIPAPPEYTLQWYDTQFKNCTIKIMICESDIAKPYEDFCGGVPSPNLDYPQEIKVVDKASVDISGHNIINWNAPPRTQSGFTTEIVNNLFKVNGTLAPNSNHIFDTGRKDGGLQLKKGTYTFSINKPLSFQIGLLLFNITWVTLKPGETSKTFTLENDYNYFTYFSCGVNKGIGYETLNEEFYIQIVEGTEEKPYFPYEKKSIENLLPVNETLVSLPNGTKDTIENGKLIKKVRKLVLDGTEGWQLNHIGQPSPNTFGAVLTVKDYAGSDTLFTSERNIFNILCNYFKHQLVYDKDIEGIDGGWGKQLFIKVFSSRLATDDIAGFKKFLADKKAQGKPVIVYYELETPVEIELPIIDIPSIDTKVEVTTNIPTVTNSRVMEHIESIELPFKSEKESTKMLYLLKAGKDYTLSGLNSVTLNMYSYNGIDRELVYTGTGGKINVTTDKVITHTSLTLKYANKFNNTVIKPQLEVGAVATEYIEGKQVHAKSTLKEFKNIFRSYDSTTHIMNNKKANMKVKYFLYQTLKNQLASFKVEQDKILSQVKESIDFTRQLKGKELEVVNALYTTVEELKISRSENAKLLLPSTKLYPSPHLFPCTNTDSFTICIDTAPSTKPTANIKKYNIATKIYMLVKGTIKDEVVIKTNAERTSCTVELVQKLQNINGVISELAEPKITKLLEVPVMLLKGTNYIYVEPNSNYNNYALDLTYIYNTELNKLFTNKTEVSSKIEQTKDAINLEVSKKVGKNEIKSAINQSAEQIKIKANNIEFEGTVTANDNFKILPDGSIEAKNGSFSGNILLDDGSKIIGGKGLLSSLQFFGNGDSYNSDMDGYAYVGFQTVEMENRNAKTGIAFNCYVPQNFSILKATMHLTFVPLKVNGANRGTIHNVRLYKQSVDVSSYFDYSLQSTITNNITSYLEDTNSLSGNFEGDTREQVIDITKNVTNGLNRLVIQSGNNPPTFNEADWDGNHYNTAINSGYLSGEVNIIGYLKI